MLYNRSSNQMEYQNRRALDRSPVADLWRRTLAQIPSVFGRLIYLASLRNPNTGLYEHHGLAARFGEQDADRAMRESHEHSFAEWLNASLGEQKADLNLYLSTVSDQKAIVQNWLTFAFYRNLVPPSARSSEEELFNRDLRHALEALRREYSIELPEPEGR